jgi:hypothetical protein
LHFTLPAQHVKLIRVFLSTSTKPLRLPLGAPVMVN